MNSIPTQSIEHAFIPCPLCDGRDYTVVYSQKDEVLNTTYTNVACKKCGFMFRNPTLSAQGYIALYSDRNNLMSGSQFVNREVGSRSSKLRKERLEFLFKNLPIQKGAVLDIGGGDGFLLQGFDTSWKRVSVDPGERTVLQEDIEFFTSGIEEFNYPKTFDVVLCVSVLEHLRDPRSIIKKIAAFLSGNGTLLLEVPNSLKPAVKISEFYSFEHICGFTPHTLESLLQSEGFEIIAVDDNPSVSNVRMVAKKVSTGNGAAIVSDYDAVAQAVEAYTAKKNEFRVRIIGLLAPVFDPQYVGKVGVYGAGSHTIELLEAVDFSDSVSCFIDSDPEKQGTVFLGKPVYSPEALPLPISLVVISSGDYQDEMHARIKHFEQERGLTVITLYPEHTL